MVRLRLPHRSAALLALLLLALGPLGAIAAPRPQTGWSIVTAPSSTSFTSAGQVARAGRGAKLDTAMAELAAQASAGQPAQALAEARGLRLDGGRVQVEIAVQPGAAKAVAAAVRAAAGDVTGSAEAGTLLQAWLPPRTLALVAAHDEVLMLRRPAELTTFEPAIAAASEALAAINVPAWHAAGQRGAGVAVAIIDGGFQGYQGLRGSDLPANLTVRNFVDGESDAQVDGTSKHGTACAEVIYDIAPAAQLYLVKIRTLVDLSEAVDWLIAQRVAIISTSFGFYNAGPGDGTGPLAAFVLRARAAGIFWATAAGNERLRHWGGSFADPDDDRALNFDGSQEVNFFGPGDGTAYGIPAGIPLRVFMRWDDWGQVNQDYDLLLLRWNGSGYTIIASSVDFQTGAPGQRPTEAVLGISSGVTTVYGFVVLRAGATRNVHFEIFAPDVPAIDEHTAPRSLANLADAPAAMTVAAVDVHAPFSQEPYSSEGPVNGPGGTPGGGALKPDIAAYANVSSSSYGAGGFNGTSSATPHVAGAAALLLAAHPGAAPADLKQQLRARAINLGAPGDDPQYGAGRLYLGQPDTTPTSALSVADTVALEGQSGDTTATFIVSLAPASSTPVSVSYATANGSATAPNDYAAVAPTLLTFTPGQTSKQVQVQVHGDALVEPNETFQLVLRNPTGATLADGVAVGTIVNDDSSGVGPALVIADVRRIEGDSATAAVGVRLTLDAPTTEPVSVSYATANGSAKAPGDYIAVPPTTLTFAPGEVSKVVQVTINGDRLFEQGSETFTLLLSNAANASIADNTATVTIVDDDWRFFIPIAMHTPTRTPDPDPWEAISASDFERGLPASWSVTDDNGSTGGVYTWAHRNCRAFDGGFSAWAVGGGANGSSLACGSNYPNLAMTRLVYGPFSLAGATAAELRYKLWLQSELNFDGLCALASIDGRNFYGNCTTGNTQGWVDRSFDLANVYQIGNLLGRTRVWVAFGFVSDNTITRPEGGYVDAMLLRKCTGRCTTQASSAAGANIGETAEIAIELQAGQLPAFPAREARKD